MLLAFLLVCTRLQVVEVAPPSEDVYVYNAPKKEMVDVGLMVSIPRVIYIIHHLVFIYRMSTINVNLRDIIFLYRV